MALKLHLQICKPKSGGKKKPSTQILQWQQDISWAVTESYTVEDLTEEDTLQGDEEQDNGSTPET